MLDLLRFELKKITRKRLNIIVVLGSLALTGFLFTLNVMQYVAIDTDGSQQKGLSAIKLEKSLQSNIKGELTEERIKNDVLQYQNLFKNPDNVVINDGKKELNSSTFDSYVGPRMPYLNLINSTYLSPNFYDGSFSEIHNLKTKNGVNFYQSRDKKVSKILNASYEGGNYSDKEKSFWIDKNNKIETPYTYGYYGGWKFLNSCIELLALPILAICICIAPIFSGEYQSGADSIILTSKYGKSKLLAAKILASFIFAFLVFSINAILATGIILSSFGVDGWNLPLQIMNSTLPYNMTFLSGFVVCIITLYLILFGMVSMTLFLSSKSSSPFSVLVIVLSIYFIPMFFKVSLENRIWDHILMLLPFTASQPIFDSYIDILSYLSYPIGNMVFDIISMRIIIYLILFIICIPFAYRGFKNHQVS